MSFSSEYRTVSSTSQSIRGTSFEPSPQIKESRSRARSLSDQFPNRKWRPWTLHPAILISTLSFTLGIIALLEYLQRSSDANHGIAFATSRDTISPALTFLYLYLPTLIAVLYSTWWSWVDLDVKRLEPWYQLVGTKNKNARDSLLLQYPVDFLAWIPFRAARRRSV